MNYYWIYPRKSVQIANIEKDNSEYRSGEPLRISAAAFSVLTHLISILLFSLYYRSLEFGDHFLWKFYALAMVSTIVSLRLFFIHEASNQIIILFLHYTLLFLIGYPFGNYIGITLILYSSLIIGISFSGSMIVHSVAFFHFILSKGDASAWQQRINRASIHDLAATITFSLFLIVISLMLKQSTEKKTGKSKIIVHLNSAIIQLTNANSGFQRYVKNLERQTLIEEHKQVSRKIHDNGGYVLTYIIMIMEEAALLPNKKAPNKRRKYEKESSNFSGSYIDITDYSYHQLSEKGRNVRRTCII